MAETVNVPEGVLIDGRWRAAGGGTLTAENPADASALCAIGCGNEADVAAAVASARCTFQEHWGRQATRDRGAILARYARLIRDNAPELARLECLDTGKPLAQARGDIAACARYFEFYAGAADKLHGETIPYETGYTVLTVREPFGVTGHIIPWNYPAQIYGRSVGAALAAGNACVLKPAEDACLSVLRLAELAIEAGLPGGALNVVPGIGEEAGAALAAHPDIDHISFTGSPAVGTLVSWAAAANHVPVTLELGGKSPQIVFADADLDTALTAVVNAIIQNAGQTCSAGSRLLVERDIYERVLTELGKRFNALTLGPGLTDPDCGPLIHAGQKDKLEVQLERARTDGVKVAAQARLWTADCADGHFVPPTLLTDVPDDHFVAREELFGPVLAVLPFTDENDAVKLANATDYALVAGVWTRDGARQLRLAHAIRAGQIFVNNYGAAGGVELPFGGMKRSGHGREKGFEGLRGFTTLKTVTIHHG